METSRNFFAQILFVLFVFVYSVYGVVPSGDMFTIGGSGSVGTDQGLGCIFDAAGYSDGIYYGQTDIHNFGLHEVLSGEWGAAVYYDGINTSPTKDPNDPPDRRQAMWLTDMFVYPSWGTGSHFFVPDNKLHQVWNNSNNPVRFNDAARSWVRNQSLEVQIDYEIADLDTITNSSLKRSPMVFYEPNSVVPSVVYSDRYVLLQTYTFRNLDPNTPITNLQFYQFLHSHGADEYGPVVSSCYGSAGLADGLQYYIPFDTVHQTGNFQYDITQWNSRPFVTANHTDYVSFSSTVEPDFVDNDLYKGHSGKPDEGTCIHIEERMLNNTAAVYNNEAGGAMGWSLGTLGAGQTKSMTIAFMCTHQEPVEAPIVLAKTDDVEEGGSVWPGNEITYTISWENDSNQDALDCVLVDYLPAGVDYPQGFGWLDPNFVYQAGDPNYNIEDHTYTWELGTIPANSSGSVQLTVKVNEKAEPGMYLYNQAVLTCSLGVAEAAEVTLVACWDGSNIIYVDSDATGANTGTSWLDAYTDLQRAIVRAGWYPAVYNQIYVAGGIYDPGRDTAASFVIPAGVSVSGGYRPTGAFSADCNPAIYKTVLSGLADSSIRNQTIVTMGNNTLLDGVSVRDSGGTAESPGQGILCKDVTAAIFNCIVRDNLNL